MAVEDQLAIVDDLLALAFPDRDAREGDRSSGPDHHISVLQASRDFWEGDLEDVREAGEEIDAAFHALADALTARWGRPEKVDLAPYLWADGPVPEPMNTLSAVSGEMAVWRRPEAGRWVALAVGQADREFPIELLAAVGTAPISPPAGGFT